MNTIENKTDEVAVVDTSNVPPCADNPDRLTDLKEFGESLAKAWDKGSVKNIRWVVEKMAEEAGINERSWGAKIMSCRRAFVIRNREIDNLRAEVTRLKAQLEEKRDVCGKCSTPFSEDSINGGRCTNCGTLIFPKEAMKP